MVSAIEYNKFRHATLEEAEIISGIKKDVLEERIKSIGFPIYGSNGASFVDRLDLGRAVYQSKNGTNEHQKERGINFERYFTDGKTDPFTTAGEYKREMTDITDDSGKVIFSKECEFPESWGKGAKTIVASKYFFKPSKPEWQAKIESGSEYTPKQLFGRISRFFKNWGEKLGYFKTKEAAQAYEEELQYLQINQMAAFNSPVNFNAGIYELYGIEGSQALNFVRDPKTGAVSKVNGCYIRPQGHACFIVHVEDNLESILEHCKTEGAIFSLGSGIGLDIGSLRGKDEPLSSGGKSSGSISFLELFDTVAGRIKSGGKTRRAARMTTIRQSHPDVLEFTRCKVKEDKKALDLIKKGYEGGFEGEAYTTVSFQNTNLSVRLDDYFFEQIKKDGKIPLIELKSGKVREEISADALLKEISFGSWRIGDPAVQYESKIQEMHTCPKSGRINSTNPCSEYVFLDDTSCNLASLNLLKFADKKGNFDVESFRKAARTILIAQDILNDAGSYPNEKIAKTSPEFRTTGLGYANLGALLMRKGLVYDSEEGRAVTAAITAIMHGEANKTSAELAGGLEPFVHYEINKLDMLNVMRKHQSYLDNIKWDLVQDGQLKNTAYQLWQEVLQLMEVNGARNAQTTVLAPTGTIAYQMGCDTTGIEPPFGLVTTKILAGGGQINATVAEVSNALKNLGYKSEQIKDIEDFIKKEKTVEGAPHLSTSHYAIFDTANAAGPNGRAIGFEGHIKMLGAAQPFISGAISKTNNLPERATVKEIYDGYVLGHELGLKAVAVFRQNSKPVSVLDINKRGEVKELKWGDKKEVPETTEGIKTTMEIGDTKFHVTTAEFKDGRVAEVFIHCYKQGSAMKAMMDNFGVLISSALRRGAPLDEIVEKHAGHEFEPKGMTDHKYIKMAKSPTDFIARWLAIEYLGRTEFANVENINKKELRGHKNGAFKAYAPKIDDWNFQQVINDSELGGFVTKEAEENETTVIVKTNKINEQQKKTGASCKSCGNLLTQTAPNCWECKNCFDKIGGCG